MPAERYIAYMRRLLACTTQAEYPQVCLETGFVKPSIFSSLEPSKMFPLPVMRKWGYYIHVAALVSSFFFELSLLSFLTFPHIPHHKYLS